MQELAGEDHLVEGARVGPAEEGEGPLSVPHACWTGCHGDPNGRCGWRWHGCRSCGRGPGAEGVGGQRAQEESEELGDGLPVSALVRGGRGDGILAAPLILGERA